MFLTRCIVRSRLFPGATGFLVLGDAGIQLCEKHFRNRAMEIEVSISRIGRLTDGCVSEKR